MKKFTSFDARKKIRGNVSDARQTLKNRHQIQAEKSGIQDARFKIRAKKFHPIKQELLKIKTSNSSERSALPGRTIHNKDLTKPKPVTVTKARPVQNLSTSKISGFISVKKGERKLIDKVTVHDTGLKIAVRNELVKNKSEKAAVPKKDQTLKISVDNPNAIKHSSSPRNTPIFHQQKPKYSRPVREREFVEWPRSRVHDPYFSLPEEHFHAPSRPFRNPFEYFTPEPRYSTNLMRRDFVDNSRPLISGHFHNRPFLPSSAPKRPFELHEVSSYSPLEGTKILVSNLHPVVVEEDILDLFSVVGPVRRARFVRPGEAEIVFVREEDAILAFQKYNNRDLDGQPMIMKILLRDEPVQKRVVYSWMNEVGFQKSRNILELEPDLLQRSLFKSSNTRMSAKPVVFTVKI